MDIYHRLKIVEFSGLVEQLQKTKFKFVQYRKSQISIKRDSATEMHFLLEV